MGSRKLEEYVKDLPCLFEEVEKLKKSSSIPVGSNREILSWVDGIPTAMLLGWQHISDQENPPPFPIGVPVYNSELPEGNQFGFGQLTSEAIPFSIPMRDDEGNFEGSIPTPPATGTYILKSVDGVVSWVEEI